MLPRALSHRPLPRPTIEARPPRRAAASRPCPQDPCQQQTHRQHTSLRDTGWGTGPRRPGGGRDAGGRWDFRAGASGGAGLLVFSRPCGGRGSLALLLAVIWLCFLREMTQPPWASTFCPEEMILPVPRPFEHFKQLGELRQPVCIGQQDYGSKPLYCRTRKANKKSVPIH